MDIATEFIKLDQEVRSGSLRMFGCWFGRPMDNIHQSRSATFEEQILKIIFDQGEILEVWNPSGLAVEGRILRIPKAYKVRWTWYYYGRPQKPENLMHLEYTVEGNKIISRTNSPCRNEASIHEAAVELH